MAQVTFLGLGAMGGPIARHLAAAGHDVTVYNRTRAKAEVWVAQHGGRLALTPAAAAEGADAVFACVGADGDLEAVTLRADGAFRAMRKGALFVDHTTASARIARQLAVEGQGSRAAGGRCAGVRRAGGRGGGEACHHVRRIGDKAMAAAQPLLDAYASRIVHVGGAGAGQQTKMVNQVCIAGAMQSVAEAIRFAQNADLDLDQACSRRSRAVLRHRGIMLNRWKTMTEEQFRRIRLRGRLDAQGSGAGAGRGARERGHACPFAALADQFYGDRAGDGWRGRQDISAVVRRLPK